ncbi:hypothetical protein, partial [Lactobacillus crispatus]
MDNPHHAHSHAHGSKSEQSGSAESNSNYNDAFMDIMQSANFSADQLQAFEAADNQPSDDEIRALFEEVTRSENDNEDETSEPR